MAAAPAYLELEEAARPEIKEARTLRMMWCSPTMALVVVAGLVAVLVAWAILLTRKSTTAHLVFLDLLLLVPLELVDSTVEVVLAVGMRSCLATTRMKATRVTMCIHLQTAPAPTARAVLSASSGALVVAIRQMRQTCNFNFN